MVLRWYDVNGWRCNSSLRAFKILKTCLRQELASPWPPRRNSFFSAAEKENLQKIPFSSSGTLSPFRPVTRILCGGVLTRPKWTKLPKCIFYCLIRLFRKVAIHEKFTLLSGYFTDPCIERLARLSCSLPLCIFLFSPTHNVLHKKLILHLRAFMRSYK